MRILFLAGVSYKSRLGGRTVQLARVLARKHEIHFLEIPSLRRPRLLPTEATHDGIRVHSLPPCWGGSWFKAMAAYLRKQAWIEDAVVLVSHPFWQPLLERLPDLEVAYDCLDCVSIHAPGSETRLTELAQKEKWLIHRAKHVFAVSTHLLQQMGDPEKCLYLPNAVPGDWFSEPFPSVTEPVVGFHGALYEWIDYDLLAEVADAFPEFKLRLAGPVRNPQTVRELRRRSNVELLPSLPFREMPELIKTFQVGLIPFLDNEVAKCADPLKTYEYLSMGKPVLSSVPLNFTNPFVFHAPRECFVGKLRELLQTRTDGETCRRSIRRETWETRAETLLAALEGDRHA